MGASIPGKRFPGSPRQLIANKRQLCVQRGLLVLCLCILLSPTGNAQTVPLGLSDTKAVIQAVPIGLPTVGVPFHDPLSGASLRRVSNLSETGGFETQIYSQLQAFSRDNAYLLLDGSEGFTIRRLSDFGKVNDLDTASWNAPRWHPTRPHVIVHFDSNDDTTVRLQFTDLDTLDTTTVYTFPERYQRVRVAPSWEELSTDGRWLAAMLTRDDGSTVIIALNLEEGTLGAQLVIEDLFESDCQPDPVWGVLEPDWIGVSPLGNYLVVQWVRDGEARCSGLETFDLGSGAFVGRVYSGHDHGDLGVDTDGVTEFFMTTELSSPADNNRPSIAMHRLPGGSSSSPAIHLLVVDWTDVGHISCRGPRGVCLVSWGRYGDTTDFAFEDEIFLLYTDGTVRRMVHHRSSKCGYWVQPRASISQDGRYAVFASDWGQETGRASCGEEGDLGGGDPYVIELKSSP